MKVVEDSLEMMFDHPPSILKLSNEVEFGYIGKPCSKCCFCCIYCTFLIVVYLEYLLDFLVHGCNVLKLRDEYKTIPSHMLGSVPVTPSLEELVSSSGCEFHESFGVSVFLVFWLSAFYFRSVLFFEIDLLNLGLVLK